MTLQRSVLCRCFILFAGLFGFAGVALAAAAAHGGGDAHLVASASAMCLAHAPALLALAIGAEKLRTAWLAGMLIGARHAFVCRRSRRMSRYAGLRLVSDGCTHRRRCDDVRLAGCRSWRLHPSSLIDQLTGVRPNREQIAMRVVDMEFFHTPRPSLKRGQTRHALHLIFRMSAAIRPPRR